MLSRTAISCGGRTLSFETGKVAKQANGAVWVQYGETVVLSTATVGQEPRKGIYDEFVPLTVDYREKSYAAGRIPGGYFKREGKPGDTETLNARLVDRPLRPLFPWGFHFDIHNVNLVISADQQNDPGLLAINGASAALMVSDIPFDGPVSAVKIGLIGDELVINPTSDQLIESLLDIVVAGTDDAIMMVEGSALEVDNETMIKAISLAHEEIKRINAIQHELRETAGKPKREFPLFSVQPDIIDKVLENYGSGIRESLEIEGKLNRYAYLENVKAQMIEDLGQEPDDEQLRQHLGAFEQIYRRLVRQKIYEERTRVDKRGFEDIRPITCEVGVLPRAHGSALFTRGETQALAAVTLGTSSDEQMIEELEGDTIKTFMLHYNFPPFCVGEASIIRGPGRREVGHGALAERALQSIIPEDESFPYVVRVVSEILESNGSSSMATVCAGTLALMDAGIQIHTPIAGIAMGLIKAEDDFIILSDIEGSEDHTGDMDFKVAGSERGITAIQMDIKISGITEDIMHKALEQAYRGRQFILQKMLETLPQPRKTISPYAPRVIRFQINPEKIRTIIGPGGKMIRQLTDETGTKIDVEQDGTVVIASPDEEACMNAKRMIEELIAEPEIGRIYKGKVVRIEDYGAFIQILPNTDGLLHISEFAWRHVPNVRDMLNEGDEVEVKIIDIDAMGKIRLSMKALTPPPDGYSPHSDDRERRPRGNRDRRDSRDSRGRGRDFQSRPDRGKPRRSRDDRYNKNK